MTRKLLISRNELDLNHSFNGGQAYRWKQTGEHDWIGIFAHSVWTLRHENDCLLYTVFRSSSEKGTENDELLLQHYFRLEEPLSSLYQQWAALDPVFAKAATKFGGVRMLQQDPIEMIFTFICSSNNSIARMKLMVDKMCKLYGEKIATIDGVTYYDFPTIDRLAEAEVQQVLEEAKFGYRAKFIQQAASKLLELGGLDWINRLLELPYIEARTELTQLSGIGKKVADCICLTSLNHLEAIPVDVHVFRIATKYYLPHLRNTKSVTDRVYNEIGSHFRSLFGKYAGWPHCVLFCDDMTETAFENVFQVDKNSNNNEVKQRKSRRREDTQKRLKIHSA